MRTPSRENLAKVAFVLSLAVLSVGYGWMSRVQGWFPDSFLVQAWFQGRQQIISQWAPRDFTSRRVYRREGHDIVEPTEIEPGLTLIVSTWRDFGWKPGLKLIDREGRVLHEWRVDPTELFSDSVYRREKDLLAEQQLHGTYLFPNGDVVANVDYAGTVRLDACSRPRWTLAASSHHSISRADDGSFWIPGATGLRPARSAKYPDGYPGIEGPLIHDRIMRVSGDGRLLDSISVLDVLYDNGLERHIPKLGPAEDQDLTHLNDVEPLSSSMADEYPPFAAGDLLLSMPPLDLVAVLEPETGQVKWHVSHPIIAQYDPDWMGDGWIGVFDNNVDGTRRGSMLGGSRIVAVQPETGQTKVLFPSPNSEPFYTGIGGKWEELDNGNLLLTEAAPGRVVEVAPDGRTLWEWVAAPYNQALVPNVMSAMRVDLTREEVASWPCSPGESTDNGGENTP